MQATHIQVPKETAHRYATLAHSRAHAQTYSDSLRRMTNAAMGAGTEPDQREASNLCSNFFIHILSDMSHILATGNTPPPNLGPEPAEIIPSPDTALAASRLFHHITLKEASRLEQIIREGPDRMPEWNAEIKHAHMVALEITADIPNPFEEAALSAEASPGQDEEDFQKQKRTIWATATTRYNESLTSVFGPQLAGFTQLTHVLNEMNIPASGAVIGFHRPPAGQAAQDSHCDDFGTTPHPALIGYTAYIHRGTRHFKSLTDPYPKGFGRAMALQHLSQAAQVLSDPTLRAEQDITKVENEQMHRLIADMTKITHMNLHDVTQQDLEGIAAEAEKAGLPPGAITTMLHQADRRRQPHHHHPQRQRRTLAPEGVQNAGKTPRKRGDELWRRPPHGISHDRGPGPGPLPGRHHTTDVQRTPTRRPAGGGHRRRFTSDRNREYAPPPGRRLLWGGRDLNRSKPATPEPVRPNRHGRIQRLARHPSVETRRTGQITSNKRPAQTDTKMQAKPTDDQNQNSLRDIGHRRKRRP